MDNFDVEAETKMQKAIESMEVKFDNIRAGRANPAILTGINVDYYGTPTPIVSLANITIPEARQLMIKPFDKNAVKEIEKAINEANIGITPINNGEAIFLTIPELNEERRKEYVKQVRAAAEETKVAIRNARQDVNNEIKKADLSEDDEESRLEDIQKITDKYNKLVDVALKAKETELMQV